MGQADLVLRPRTRSEVQAMVRATARMGLPLVAQGGATGLVGGATAQRGEVLLSLKRLNQIRQLDTVGLSVTAEAGCILADLQRAAAEKNLLMPLSLAAEGSCTLGGNLATNAGGTQVLRWGNARDLCLGLEVVTADGDCWSDLDGLRKDHRGLNLRDLFIGSEGTLGIITAAVMKLAPAPRSRMAAWVTLDSLAQALDLLCSARTVLGDALSGFEVMGEAAQTLIAPLPLPVAPWAVLLELSSPRDEAPVREDLVAWLGQMLERAWVREACVSHSLAQFQAFWALRESIPGAQTRAGGNLKHDISLPLRCIPQFVHECEAALAQHFPGARPVVFGHLGDGNLHYNIAPPEGQTLATFSAQEPLINRVIFDLVAKHQGSFSAEHGIGRLRAEELAHRGNSTGLALMHRIKRALDPQNRLNPGRVLLASRPDGP
ncbi:FAD-binding oxidoreductase [Inhella sp. 4Y17]|uniref:FAD-binding oxidoreductase n=2 Tax=Inhella gelatinilytica TaxID=2795030 RepID=A0A931IYB1_9BURK|nr:FAD-binding oxidoreductase [Inhella gelatinilytica]